MEIKIGDLVKFKLKPATSDLEGHEDSGIVKKKGDIFYNVNCNGYIILVKPSEIIENKTMNEIDKLLKKAGFYKNEY